MAPTGTVFGGRKFRGGRDPAEEQAALQWIYTVLREPIPQGAQFDELLRDGQILCRFMQKLRPDLVRKYNASGGPIKLMENLGIFTEACRQIGVNHKDLFQSTDLWDKRDIGSVYNCLSQLGLVMERDRPDLPRYNPKIAEEIARQYTTQMSNTSNGGSGNVTSGHVKGTAH